MEATTATPTRAGRASRDESIPFPSLRWFERLGEEMHHDRTRHEHLGDVDCVAEFRILDAGGRPRSIQVRFEEFDVVDVRDATDPLRADFVVEGSLATWREMIENIAAHGGRPDLHHTLNYLTLPATPMRVTSDCPVRRDLFFRFNQSLQEFVNASAAFHTEFAEVRPS